MANKKQIKKSEKQKVNPLMIGAVAVAAIAVSLVLFAPKGSKNSNAGSVNTTETIASANTAEAAASSKKAALNDDGDVVINVADITENATFYEYDFNGTTMGFFAVKASDGTIRTALNTCQVCNGSPYAYFEQQGDSFQCQNCGNQFSLDMIGQERGGCNPVPITEDDEKANDTKIVIPAKYFKDNAERFTNWKKF
ncbi:DUF2318 domain-containing protein [Anaerocolumna sp. MB42-C2]|uniref:DUF2318 domain-containing protein n=1 Tax=Anaerocolumna sp. MB42-C2 TaxID=3070997 RepID=UPI0027DFCE12|nr:DUF2318 domain-containing protein [Anaerocolumna sp. MB42-C2]WMJ87859.1 DUF2318 domain-containing protein [Anaerocolumna sp. MB42-C2]